MTLRTAALAAIACALIVAACGSGSGEGEGDGLATTGDPTPTIASPGEPTVELPEYRIVEAEDASHKALEGPLSSYTLEELERLPLDKRFFYRIVVSNDVTTAQIRPMIDAIIADLTVKDGELDEVVLFFYSDEGQIDSAYDIAKATWAPKGELGNVTPLIASTNDRESYRTSVEINENLEEYLRQRNLEETKFGLTEQQRRQFFKDLVAAEDRAQAEADRLFPIDDPLIPDYESNLNNNFDTFDRLADGYRLEVRDQYGVTQEQQYEISAEAFNEGWPFD